MTAAGLLPFIAGAVLSFAGKGETIPADGSYPLMVGQDGIGILCTYGLVIFSYMCGCFWGFASKAPNPNKPLPYIIAVLPALYAFFYIGRSLLAQAQHGDVLLHLTVGFTALLVLDFWYQKINLAPAWWMTLRVPVTCVVVLCLSLGSFSLTT
ncbi:DUF3429 domain-containing protein [Pacificibacter maritimus]|uniref:DUF3429 domain-containing protein n=1 Tax=Pacificibacter maritimus TaxID=762213 RepID=UPI001473C7C0